MLPNILIVLGTLFTVLGGIGLVAINIHPFFKAIRIIFFHSIDDLVYDSVEGRTAIEKARKTLKRSFTFFLGVGLILLLPGLWLNYAPRGNDSFLSTFIDGAEMGNDHVENQQENSNSTVGSGIEVKERDSFCEIIVKEKRIIVHGQEIGGTKDFETYLESNELNRRKKIFLVDDYAVSSTYHEIMELLDAKGMDYEIESDE